VDIPNLKNIARERNMHAKRASDRTVFWLAILVLIFLAHCYLYREVVRLLPLWVEALWICLGLLAMISSVAAQRLGAPREGTAFLPLRGFSQRFGAVWNTLVVLTTTFMFAAHIAGLPPEKSFYGANVLALAVCAYGVHEAMSVRTVEMRLATPKLARGKALRILQLSDLHVGPFMHLNHVRRIVEAAIRTRPDIVVVTGDLVDGLVGNENGIFPHFRTFAAELRRLADMKPRLGVWAVPGNHDHYESYDGFAAFAREAGIHVLKSAKKDLGDLLVVGADDLDHLHKDEGVSKSQALLSSLLPWERDKFVLLLRHRPVVEPSTPGRFDLQLSGHTHGGQMFTVPSSRHRIPGRPRGLLSLAAGAKLYVSNGAGYVGPPMRFLAPAEIDVIELEGQGERA
jgi:Predicted phosphohydrolases